MIPPVFLDALDQGAVAVTVNQRLSRTLTRIFDRRQADNGRKAWPAAQILPWDAWLRTLYRQARDGEGRPWQMLSDSQAQHLWEQVIGSSKTDIDLLDVRGAASLARTAWAIQHDWGVEAAGRSIDQTWYAKWSEVYFERCKKNLWVDTGFLTSWLVERVDRLSSQLPRQLLVIGFDTVSAAQRELLDALKARGVDVLVDDLPGGRTDNARLMACEEERQEVRAAAIWARQQLADDSARKIAIVVPELQRLRAALLDELHWALDPATALSPETVQSSHYNISLGAPLSTYPMIADALAWLRLIAQAQPLDACIGLLLSAYLKGAEEERAGRAAADLRLLELPRTNVGLPQLAAFIRRMGDDSPAQLREGLDALVREADQLPKRQTYAGWSRAIGNLLEALGWPGDRTLSSEEYQLHGAWQQTLRRLSEFDLVASPCSIVGAVSGLANLLQSNIFQLESAADARLQIVGLLEVAGMQFDAMWVMGMDEQSWPQRHRFNPFLSAREQRAADVPHCSPQWEYGFAQRTLNRLHASAGELIFSYATKHDEAERGPSAMLSHLPKIDIDMPPLPVWIRRATRLETIEDALAPRLPEGTTMSGGVQVLSDQADCPFRAFALHRLGLRPPEELQTGVSARDRGSLLHAAMEALWAELKDQSTLLAVDEQVLHAAIDSAIDKAFSSRRLNVDAAYLEIEHEHLRALMRAWLEVEKKRGDFSVESLEQKREISIGGLRFSLRLDRADRLGGGERMLIDYKTGNPKNAGSIKALLQPRPSDAQLPLYALADTGEVSAVALAFVRPLQSQFKGVSDEEFAGGDLKGITAFSRDKSQPFASWDEVQSFWRSELEALAREFAEGVASVTPKNAPSTCQYCALDPLCRVGSAVDAGEGHVDD